MPMDKKLKGIIRKVLNKHAQEASSANPKLRRWIGDVTVESVINEIEEEFQKEADNDRKQG